MIFIPSFFFFISSLILGIYIRVSSLNWIYVWMGLEINMISFIPLMISSQTILETERALKYFLVQALGSGLLLLGVFLYRMSLYLNSQLLRCSYLLMFRLIIKLGIFPFHYWLPHVIGGSRWITCFIISVVQKIAPIFVLFNLFRMYRAVIGFLGGLGSLIGGLGGLNQSQLRFILAYSSIGHIGWIVICRMLSYRLFLIYFSVYRIINLRIIIVLRKYNLKSLDIIRSKNISIFFFFVLSFIFMSLGGLPPFLGFYPKIIVINIRIMYGYFLILFVLVLGSLINIFYYLNIFFNLYLNSYFNELNLSDVKSSLYFNMMCILFRLISVSGLGFFYVFLFYAMVLFYKS